MRSPRRTITELKILVLVVKGEKLNRKGKSCPRADAYVLNPKHNFVDIWKYASEDSGVRVTPQVLREWFYDEMGRLGAPDRYVDAFCGRLNSGIVLGSRNLMELATSLKHENKLILLR